MAEQAVNDEHAEIKKRAMRRLIVAGTLVTAAVVALTVLNYKSEERVVPATTSGAPAVATPEPAPPEAVPTKTAEEAPPETPVPDVLPAPDSEAAPTTAPPPPEVLNKPSQFTPAAAKPRTEAISAPAPSKAAGTAIAESSTPQAVTISPPSPAKKSTAPTSMESKPIAVPAAPPARTTETTAPKAYVVQLGLFSNYENAVQLQKRLADHGIKSYTETRLHVGPFQSKAEAEQAMTRIRSMGINAVLVPTR